MSTTSTTTVSRVELARILGVNESTLFRWAKEGMPGSSSRGRGGSSYAPALVIAWCRATGKFGSASADGETLDKDRETALLTREKRIREEMENAVRRGELVEAAEVTRSWTDIVVAVRSRLQGVPTKAARLVVGKTEREVRATLAHMIDEVLRELGGDDAISGEHRDAGVHAAAVSDGKRVGGRKPDAVQRSKRRTGSVADK
jgi:phage terminase Nu1 subunit (DNA packaging protein)